VFRPGRRAKPAGGERAPCYQDGGRPSVRSLPSVLTVCAISLLACISTVLLHYEGLRAIDRLTALTVQRTRATMLCVILGIFALHVAEIGLYSGIIAFVADVLHLGRLVGDVDGTSMEYLYFSAETFTTLGFGDILPEGQLRLLTSLEPLNGLILLAWSGSFTFLEVQRHWRAQGNGSQAWAVRDRRAAEVVAGKG
jgi:hypothetical protein